MHHGQNNMTLFIILAYPVGNSPTMLISYLSCNLANVDISVAIITYIQNTELPYRTYVQLS